MKSIAVSLLILAVIVAVVLFGTAHLSRRTPERLFEPIDGRLAPCPGTPNCVSSQASSDRARVAAFKLGNDPVLAFAALVELVVAQPGFEAQEVTAGAYLHATYRSPVFGFVDDLELLLNVEDKVAEVRSAARIGHSDLGQNRARVERLQALWAKRSNS